ncbi:MAG: hypothetical protein ACRETX_09870 [Steroidobacteraceae bacterium]
MQLDRDATSRGAARRGTVRRMRLVREGDTVKLRELIKHLQGIEGDLIFSFGDEVDPVVVAAIQPSNPLAHTIECVTCLEEDDTLRIDDQPVVWIAIGNRHPDGISPNAPRVLFEDAS